MNRGLRKEREKGGGSFMKLYSNVEHLTVNLKIVINLVVCVTSGQFL